MPLKPSISASIPLPPASGPFIPKQSWKSSSLPIKMSDTEAISVNISRNSLSRPFQNDAR